MLRLLTTRMLAKLIISFLLQGAGSLKMRSEDTSQSSYSRSSNSPSSNSQSSYSKISQSSSIAHGDALHGDSSNTHETSLVVPTRMTTQSDLLCLKFELLGLPQEDRDMLQYQKKTIGGKQFCEYQVIYFRLNTKFLSPGQRNPCVKYIRESGWIKAVVIQDPQNLVHVNHLRDLGAG